MLFSTPSDQEIKDHEGERCELNMTCAWSGLIPRMHSIEKKQEPPPGSPQMDPEVFEAEIDWK